jgi:hypothetical protein
MSKKKTKVEQDVETNPPMPDISQIMRFDLENKILNTWQIIDDIKLLASRNATKEEWDAVCTVYDVRFDDTFTYFEQMVREGRIQ